MARAHARTQGSTFLATTSPHPEGGGGQMHAGATMDPHLSRVASPAKGCLPHAQAKPTGRVRSRMAQCRPPAGCPAFRGARCRAPPLPERTPPLRSCQPITGASQRGTSDCTPAGAILGPPVMGISLGPWASPQLRARPWPQSMTAASAPPYAAEPRKARSESGS